MSLIMWTESVDGLWHVPLAIAAIAAICIALAPPARRFHDLLFSSSQKSTHNKIWGVGDAERGTLVQQSTVSGDDLFQLEKRAFFSKTWLFVCHQSRFEKIGDYHTFDVGGLSFFVVLGKDGKVRAFQNVCRHRAYTVVRKECGTSTRFSCRYHGWQYDDQGKLVKAPKFESNPDFRPDENGLFEIKLILTRDGLIYVNFDATTLRMPFDNVRSGLDMEAYHWLDGAIVSTTVNWKVIANDFLDQARWSRIAFGWVFPRKMKAVRLLGPLSIAKDLDDDVWSTMTLLPVSFSKSAVRIDVYSKPGHDVSSKTTQKWKWILEQEVLSMNNSDNSSDKPPLPFSYECGGRMIDLSAILYQHQRSESVAKRKLHPAIRITGFDLADQDAAALCDTIDGMMTESIAGSDPELTPCTRVPSFSRRLEW